MNNIETAKIHEFIRTAYRDAEYLNNPEAVELWTRALADISFTDASHAISAWICEERWPPTIADIRAKVYNLRTAPDVLASQAWDQLLRALGLSHAPEAEKIWNELPEATRLVVGGFATFRAWGNTDTASLESVQRPMFMKRFELMQAKTRKEGAIPKPFREPAPSLPERNAPAIEDKADRSDGRRGVPAPADRMAELRRRLGGKAG